MKYKLKKVITIFALIIQIAPMSSCCVKHTIEIDEMVLPTCYQTGLTSGSHCATCGKIIEKQEIIEKTAHEVVYDERIEPTCKSIGITEGSHCGVCGEIIIPQKKIELIDHKIVIDNEVTPTCSSYGYTSGIHCEVCNEVLLKQEQIDKVEHKIVIDKEVAPTCYSTGLTSGSHCEVCGEIIVKQEIVEKTKHNYVIDESVKSTCYKEGKSTGMHCDVCNEVFVSQVSLDKEKHTKGKFIDFATINVDGLSTPGVFECLICKEHYYDDINYDDINFPIMSLNGELNGITKEVKKNIVIDYCDENNSFSYNSTIKFQGSSSLAYPKKNYNIQFFKDETYSSKQKVKISDDWGKQSKYTLKANYVDYSQARNIVSANLYGQIAHQRGIDDGYNKAFNGGAIDGFPIVLYSNGTLQGLYTLNTSKDDYIFNMSKEETSKEAILMAGSWTDTNALKVEMSGNYDDGWELEYCSTEDGDLGISWVKESFNNFIRFLNNSTDAEFIANVSNYTDVDRVIDSMILTWVCKALDNCAKNILYSTYDGIHWVPTVYDLDGTWGLYWDGSFSVSTDAWVPHNTNKLWDRVWDNYQTQIKNRYIELRNSLLSISNIDKLFVDYRNQIPANLYLVDSKLWSGVPSVKSNHVTQIITWANEYLVNIDNALKVSVDDIHSYTINFNNLADCYVKIYFTDDYLAKSDISNVTIARDGDSGYATNSGGQVNFEIVVPDGYEIDNITITGDYKNLKGPDETLKANTYRVTKIDSNLNISYTIKETN